GEVVYPKTIQILFGGESIEVFEGQASLRFDVKVSSGIASGRHVLRGTLTVQACDDKTCLAPSKMNVNIPFQVTGGSVPSVPARSALSTQHPTLSLWRALLAAFIGGIILNLMPCVLPVIAIKILGFVQQSGDSPAKTRRLGFIFGLGV